MFTPEQSARGRAKGVETNEIVFDDTMTAALFRLRNGQQLRWLDVAEDMGLSLDRLMKEVRRLRDAGYIIMQTAQRQEQTE